MRHTARPYRLPKLIAFIVGLGAIQVTCIVVAGKVVVDWFAL